MKNTLVAFGALCAFAALCASAIFAQDSPKQAMREVPFVNVKLDDNFWAPRIEANRVVSVPHNIGWCETETGRINNFKIAAGLAQGEFSGIYFDDSDVYKIIEGFAYSLAARPDDALKAKADEWFEYEFKTPRKLTSAIVYWFDDEANGGGRRVPAAWKLTYYDAQLEKWLDVEAQDAYALDKDRDVVVNFKEIEASKIRINAQLKPGYSSGILRWVVK